jgi:hypothetical protein
VVDGARGRETVTSPLPFFHVTGSACDQARKRRMNGVVAAGGEARAFAVLLEEIDDVGEPGPDRIGRALQIAPFGAIVRDRVGQQIFGRASKRLPASLAIGVAFAPIGEETAIERLLRQRQIRRARRSAADTSLCLVVPEDGEAGASPGAVGLRVPVEPIFAPDIERLFASRHADCSFRY